MKRFKSLHSTDETAGFTLLEMFVIIIMLAILAAIAAPGWLGYMNRQRVNRARSDLAQIIQNAQTEAQQRNSARVIWFEEAPGTPGPATVQVRSTTGATATPGRELSVGGEQNANIELTTNTQEFEFNYKGEAPGAPYIVSVASEASNNPRCIIVSTILGNVVQAEGDECDATLYN